MFIKLCKILFKIGAGYIYLDVMTSLRHGGLIFLSSQQPYNVGVTIKFGDKCHANLNKTGVRDKS